MALRSSRQVALTEIWYEAYVVSVSSGEILAEFTEVESGKRSERPQLARALEVARSQRATLLIPKLDRLARNARFLLGIVESGVDVVFCDLPNVPPGPVGKFLITQLAAVAELEASLISQRTKAALALAKARGCERIARELNERQVKTARGGRWGASTVRNVLAPDHSMGTRGCHRILAFSFACANAPDQVRFSQSSSLFFTQPGRSR